jgi:para-nitrobenzyl esterase
LSVKPSTAANPPSRPVAIDGGLISGEMLSSGVAAFKGIPYAAPPVGGLRWRAPQPVAAWKGVKKADHFGPACMQNPLKPGSFYQLEFYRQTEPISEDCLFLNVWVPPATAKEAAPVLLWIHGGGFVEGSGSLPSFDGENLARKGAIVVTINYRLGIFGFLAHPELTQEASYKASGNYGLLDQRAALQWVQHNIQKFGGDAGNVTIFGQSAGAMSILAHAASPLSAGLYSKAIMQSGAFLPMPPLPVAEQTGINFMKAIGSSSLEQLRAKSAEELQKAATTASKLTTNVSRFFPIVDGYFLPTDVLTTFQQGKQNPVAFMTGSTADEGTTIIPAVTDEEYKKSVQTRFGEKAGEYLKLYPAATDAQAWRAEVDNLRDTMAAASLRLAELMAEKGMNSYIYYFDRRPPGRDDGHYGAFHSSDLVYVFNNLGSVDRPWTDADRKLAAIMSSYWVNFAKYGNPNGDALPRWPAFDGKLAGTTLELGDEVRPNSIPDRARLEEISKQGLSLAF